MRFDTAGRLGIGGLLLGASGLCHAQADPAAPTTVFVTGRDESLLGSASSASEGTVGRQELGRRPILRPGEVLETVPGVIITQHAGAGKANQYFLRGFNLDHGTDFATSVDGVPINLGTHAHGQGYTDLNWLIPELVRGVDYRKGPYYADLGDFSSVGAANIRYIDHLHERLLSLSGGTYGYARLLFADNYEVAGGRVLYAFEGFHDDGAWVVPSAYWRANGVLKYSRGNERRGWSISALAHYGNWTSTDQVPTRAVSGDNDVPGGFAIDRFGTLDSSSGGATGRASISAEWHRRTDRQVDNVLLYAYRYGLDLYSNFTGYLDQKHGDEIFQRDRRTVVGTKFSHAWSSAWAGHTSATRLGLDVRADFIEVGLYKSELRRSYGSVRLDDVVTAGFSPWVDHEFRWTPWLRTHLGVRADVYGFDVTNHTGGSSRSTWAAIPSPKGSVIFGPWHDTEFYLSAGLGFHTADARATAVTSGRASVFSRQRGGEVGLRFTRIAGLQSTLAFWLFDSDNETVFVGDEGANEPTGRSGRRLGLEWTNYYRVTDWLTLDADFALSRARFLDRDPTVGDYVPDSVVSVLAAGLSVHGARSFFGSVRLRYFGPRPLIEDNSVRTSGSALLNVKLGYRVAQYCTVTLEVLNALNSRVSDQEYYYATRLRNEPENTASSDGGYLGRVVHPAEPISARVGLILRF